METSAPAKPLVPSWATLLAANVVPIFGVLLGGWGLFPLVFLYWLENGVIGLMTLVKLLLVPGGASTGRAGRIAMAGFFSFHYGGFMAGHGLFILVLFSAQRPEGLEGQAAMGHVLGQIPNPGLMLAALGLLASHGWSLVSNFLLAGQRRRAKLKDVMMAPYGRVVMLHLFIIGGAWVILSLGSQIALLLLFVGMKTGVDLCAHLWEHRRKTKADTPG